jgi:hypothetical protein
MAADEGAVATTSAAAVGAGTRAGVGTGAATLVATGAGVEMAVALNEAKEDTIGEGRLIGADDSGAGAVTRAEVAVG